MIPRVLYHSTSGANAKWIDRGGLIINRSTFWSGCGGCIYLSDDPTSRWGKVVYEVDTHMLDITRVSVWEYICWENISPERLRRVDVKKENKTDVD